MDIKREEAFALAQQDMGLDPDATAAKLRELYRYDGGQTINLCYRYLAAELPNEKARLRPEVASVVGDYVNRDAPEGMQIGTAAIAEMLWTRFGGEPDVLSDLAPRVPRAGHRPPLRRRRRDDIRGSRRRDPEPRRNQSHQSLRGALCRTRRFNR